MDPIAALRAPVDQLRSDPWERARMAMEIGEAREQAEAEAATEGRRAANESFLLQAETLERSEVARFGHSRKELERATFEAGAGTGGQEARAGRRAGPHRGRVAGLGPRSCGAAGYRRGAAGGAVRR